MAKKNQAAPASTGNTNQNTGTAETSVAPGTAPSTDAVASTNVQAKAKRVDATVTVYRLLDRLMQSAPDKDDGIEAGTKVRGDVLAERGVLERMLNRGDVLEHVWSGPESQYTDALLQ